MTHATNINLAWIGAGAMGTPMAAHFLDAGYPLTIHTRTKTTARPLLDRGARWAPSPAEAADGADVAFSMVGFPDDVRDVHLGPRGTLQATHHPRVIVDMSTTPPALAVEIHHAAHARGLGSIDAPVSGGRIGAENASLSIMVGADEHDFELVQPLLQRLGDRIVHHGGPGAGQHAKIVNQILIATNIIGVCEGLLYAHMARLDPLKVIASVESGAAGSWSVSNFGPRMIRRDFEPTFFVEHFVKDLRIALAEARHMKLALPGLRLAERLYRSLLHSGRGRLGIHALLLALEELNDIRP